MTQRSILAIETPTIVIKAGADVTIRGQAGERVVAESGDRWGLKIERKWARIEVQIGRSGSVFVPFDSDVAVYAGKNIDLEGLLGEANCYAGFKLRMHQVYSLGNAGSGWTMDLDCQTLSGTKVDLSAGGDLRFHIRNLTSARLRVKDLGGYWEALIGDGEKLVSLKSGGDVTLVTDQKVNGLPPNFVLGKIEKPSAA